MTTKRVLIVDDESGFTRLIRLTLERTDRFIVREENDSTQGWLTAREFQPDIVFLDVVMPKLDGGGVAQQIRSDPSLAHVPVIFLTAIVSEKEGVQEIDGFPFLAKPVSLEAIVRCIEEHTGVD
jgi:CheY-like chemotaxis protein